MPLDRDIVREMWVRGDLKDRLGLQHRRSRKDGPNLEAAPMLLSPHLRSRSELDQPVYQPVHMTSPASSPHHTGVTTQSSPSVTPNESLSSIEDEHAQYLVVGNKSANPSPLSHSSLPGAPSPDPSYYSATMFPTPSPLPTSQYGAPTHPLDSGPSQLLVSSQPPSPTPHTLAVPGRTQHVAESSDANSGSYEMSIRSPPPDQNDLSRASEFSWATAREANGSEGQRTPTLAPPGQPHDRPDSSLSWTGGRAL
jgi:phospholipid-translocating ATPase